jgi:hypothetical protein
MSVKLGLSYEGEKHRLSVFQDKVLRKIFGLRGRKLHSEELHDLYSTPSIIWMITSRLKRWVVHVACMGKNRNAQCFGWEI